MGRIRVLVVDDSAFARKVLREALSTSPAIEVVGHARDGLEALERIAELKPDVVTLDLVMPNLDGLGVLRALDGTGPRVVVVSVSDADSDLAIEALQRGAIDLVHKPTALATSRLYELSSELVAKVIAAAGAQLRAYDPGPAAPAPRPERLTKQLVAIGTSTGGPQALTRLLRALPGSFPVPVVMVLHIPTGYTASMAERLHDQCDIDVAESRDGLVLRPGLAVLARAGEHLRLERRGRDLVTRQIADPGSYPHCPAVDVLFESAAQVVGAGTLGVVLTGMGDDGTAGARRIVEAGGEVLTEAESSCIVYGMPRSVAEAGLSSGQAPLETMAQLMANRL